MGAFLRKYGTGAGAALFVPLIKRGVVDFAVAADWTPAAGDVKVSIDGAAAVNIGTLPVAVVMGNTAMWKFVFADAELQGKTIAVTVADATTKAVEDQMFVIETYGHGAAMYPPDFSDAAALGLARLDTAVGSRLAAASYTVPDNAGIASASASATSADSKATAIKAKTDNLPASPAAIGDAMTLTAAYDAAKTAASQASVTALGTPMQAGAHVQLATTQDQYAPAKAGDAMTLTAAYDAAKTAASQASVTALGTPMQAGAHVQLATTQDQYAPAKAGDAMTLTSAYDAAKTAAQPGDAMTLTGVERDAIAAALLDLANGTEAGETVRQTLRLMRAALLGMSDGFPAGPVHFRDKANTKNRITATVDADGNRSAVTTDAA